MIEIFYFLFISFVLSKIPVSVMLPLNVIKNDMTLNNPNQLKDQFFQLKRIGVTGIMTDVWWGLVERDTPKQYNWEPYLQLINLAKNFSLKVQVVMSFHQCGGNVGDQCNIPLPIWVRKIGNSNKDIYYRDSNGNYDNEYLSLGVDNQTLFYGRSPIQIYTDYMTSFANIFKEYLENTIDEVQVGLGPAGELRYPSYQIGKWQYCGVGEFQCYDKYLLQDLKNSATKIGHPEWGNSGPNNAGNYNSSPLNTPFFMDNSQNNYASSYGKFFLNWYSSKLLEHGRIILSSAKKIFSPFNVNIAGFLKEYFNKIFLLLHFIK
jgi:beta-amylase